MPKEKTYHIDKNGMPAICVAKEGRCPRKHFSNLIEAQRYSDALFQKEYENEFRSKTDFSITFNMEQQTDFPGNEQEELEVRKQVAEIIKETTNADGVITTKASFGKELDFDFMLYFDEEPNTVTDISDEDIQDIVETMNEWFEGQFVVNGKNWSYFDLQDTESVEYDNSADYWHDIQRDDSL